MTNGRNRRDVLRAGVALCPLGLAGCLDGGGGDDGNGTPDGSNSTDGTSEEPPAPEPVTAWPQQQYDAQNTAAVPNADAPILHVEELWRRDLGADVRSSPVVAEAMIYVRDRSGTVHAVDAEGSEQWTASVPDGELLTTPAIYEDLLVVPHDAGLVAFDRSDGTEQWQYSSDRGTTNLTVADDAVFFSDTYRSVHAVDAETGQERWQSTENPGLGFYMEPPAVHDGDVIVPKTAGGRVDFREIAAIDLQTGGKRPLFRTSDYRFSAGISIADDRLFAPTPGGIRAYDREGTELWHFPTEKPVEAGLAATADVVLGITLDNAEGTLFAVNSSTGEQQWEASFWADTRTVPIVIGSSAVVGTLDEKIVSFRISSGREYWSVEAAPTFLHQGTFSDGQFFFAGGNGKLFSYGEV